MAKSSYNNAMDACISALEYNMAGYTLWNYNSYNTGALGDGWNLEDLSIYSEGKLRAVEAIVRPFPLAVAGIPHISRFDLTSKTFVLKWTCNSLRPTEIFIPDLHYSKFPSVTFNGRWELLPLMESAHVLLCWGELEKHMKLTVRQQNSK